MLYQIAVLFNKVSVISILVIALLFMVVNIIKEKCDERTRA